MSLVGDLVVNLGVNSRRFQSGLGSARGSLRSFTSGVSSSLGRVTGFAAGLAGTAAAAIGVGSAIGAIADGFNRAVQFEQLEVAFGVIFKSTATAKAVLSDLSKFANTTPFELPELATAAKQLAGFGFAAGDINPTLRMLGDISAGLSIPLEDLAYLFGTTKTEGRLMSRDLNQFLARGIPLLAVLAEQFGVAESEVRGLVEQGKVGFPEVEQAMRTLTAEGGQFGGMMEKQSQTVGGMLSTLRDAVGNSLREISEAFLKSFDFKGLIDRATAWARQFGDIVTFAIRNAKDIWNLGMTDMTLAVVGFAGSVIPPLVGIWDGSMAAFGVFFENIKGGLTELGNLASALGKAIKDGLSAAFAGHDPVTAFKDSFIKALAEQKDAVSAGNPVDAFTKAFKASSSETGGFFDDMQAGLIEDRDRILNNIANRETRFSEQQAAEAAAAAGLEQSGPTAPTGSGGKAKKTQIAAGSARGSKEALDSILRAGMRGKDPTLKVAEQQLAEQKLATSALQTLAANPPMVVVGDI